MSFPHLQYKIPGSLPVRGNSISNETSEKELRKKVSFEENVIKKPKKSESFQNLNRSISTKNGEVEISADNFEATEPRSVDQCAIVPWKSSKIECKTRPYIFSKQIFRREESSFLYSNWLSFRQVEVPLNNSPFSLRGEEKRYLGPNVIVSQESNPYIFISAKRLPSEESPKEDAPHVAKRVFLQKASSLPERSPLSDPDWMHTKKVDGLLDNFLISLRSANDANVDPNAIISWVPSHIRCLSNVCVTSKISKILVNDNEKVRELLDGAIYDTKDAHGAYVSEMYTFSANDESMVIKRIPKASKLATTHRGFQVGPLYRYGQRSDSRFFSRIIRSEQFDFRPLANLLMLRQMCEALQNFSGKNDICKCFIMPIIGCNSNFNFYQIMPFVDTKVSIQYQTLPRNEVKIQKLVQNLCDAAVLSNLMLQADCSPSNLCLKKDEDGDIIDICMFDCDVLDSGSPEDEQEIFDFTNPLESFSEDSVFRLVDSRGVCYDVRASLPPIVSKRLLETINQATPVLRQISSDYANPSEQGQAAVPFMLQENGLIEQWSRRVMVLSEDGKLYKNALSSEHIDFDVSVALFLLKKLRCSNDDRLSLFMLLSFQNLNELYKEFVSAKEEESLAEFFKDFLILSKQEPSFYSFT